MAALPTGAGGLRPVYRAPVVDVTRFPIRFTGANRAMVMLGLTRANSYVEVSPTELTVHMGAAFRARVHRSAVLSVGTDHERVLGWGVHGWRGEWLVNGSSSGLVRIEFDPPGRARTLGWPVHLHVLRVAVDDPDGLVRALQPEPTTPNRHGTDTDENEETTSEHR
jgi:hypothetical protein